eukprot:SAG11_NODE_2015_length_3921_cov_2.436944_7_plen_68_part_00
MSKQGHFNILVTIVLLKTNKLSKLHPCRNYTSMTLLGIYICIHSNSNLSMNLKIRDGYGAIDIVGGY